MAPLLSNGSPLVYMPFSPCILNLSSSLHDHTPLPSPSVILHLQVLLTLGEDRLAMVSNKDMPAGMVLHSMEPESK